MLSRYCFGCHGHGKHKGGLALDTWTNAAEALADSKTWQRVLQKVQAREMPPENKPQPAGKQRHLLVSWIEKAVLHCDCDHPDPGRVTLRRLNRAEYNNTIRDLLGVDFKPADDFPVDDSGYGFDTIGDVLSLSPVLFEKYLAAAQQALDIALGPAGEVPSRTDRFPVDALELGYNAKQRGDGWVALNSIEEDDVALNYVAQASGAYNVRVHAYARQQTNVNLKLTFMLGHQPVKVVEVETNAAAARVYEARVRLPAGPSRLRAVVRRIKDNLPEAEALKWKTGPQQKGAVFVDWLEVEGPFEPDSGADAPARRRIFFTQAAPGHEAEAERDILRKFVSRAWRREPAANDLIRLVELAEGARKRASGSEPGFEEGIRVALQAALVSPHFLFREEPQRDPDNPKSVSQINEFALASRLSYFLWGTMPDDGLFGLAGQGKLRKNLPQQIRRMLTDPKARALVENFAGQWLQIRNLDLSTPDAKTFPGFDEALRISMKRETELFFETMLREDRTGLEFLSADWTFVNERLARHYGIAWRDSKSTDAHVAHASRWKSGDFPPAHFPAFSLSPAVPAAPLPLGDDPTWQRVSLRSTPRRGLLTQGAILTLTSNPTRTSPVKRGKWVLENLLNVPPPPPLPDVPPLKEGKELKGTLRQRMEQHRADPICASCHDRMDPIGFGLENFDGIGAWRTVDGEALIDPAGELGAGQKFSGPQELVVILAKQKQEQFVRCLVEKLLTYALGRGLEYYDKCAIDEICRRLPKRGYKFSALVLEIAKSVPFQMRRGDSGVNR